MRELALHLLDIAENSVMAGANQINIVVEENSELDFLNFSIEDNGKGMDEEMVSKVIDPFVTSRTTRNVGLGIPLLKAAAEACNGNLRIESTPGIGTKVSVTFQHSHIDRMPLGDLPATILNLVVSYPKINWTFKYKYNNKEFMFDDKPIKDELQGLTLTEPAILSFIREFLVEGINGIIHQNQEPIST